MVLGGRIGSTSSGSGLSNLCSVFYDRGRSLMVGRRCRRLGRGFRGVAGVLLNFGLGLTKCKVSDISRLCKL